MTHRRRRSRQRVLDSAVGKYELKPTAPTEGSGQPIRRSGQPGDSACVSLLRETSVSARASAAPSLDRAGKLNQAQSRFEQAKAGVARPFGEIGARVVASRLPRCRQRSPQGNQSCRRGPPSSRCIVATDRLRSRVGMMIEAQKMSARCGRRRGSARRPRGRRAGEQNAVLICVILAPTPTDYRRRPGSEIGGGEYAGPRAPSRRARTTRGR